MNISSFYKSACRNLLLLVLFGWSAAQVQAQEFSARVSVNSSQLSGTSLNYIDDMAEDVQTYINDHNWISARFRPEERIQMDLQITLLSVDSDYNFEAQLIIRTRRPIYNTRQETLLLLFNDENWEFNYRPSRTLIHDDLQFDEFTSVIDFYAYLALGLDFDSFEELGGTPYYREAQNIVSQAQSASADWSRSRNSRDQLVNDLLSGSYAPLRRAIYKYHRHGLDLFVDNPEQARTEILAALELIKQAQRSTSRNVLFDLFFNAKYRELVSIFEDADQQMRQRAYELLSELDQGHLSTYGKIRN